MRSVICTMIALKASNNLISNKSLLETAQNLGRSFVNYFFGTFGDSCAWLYDKKIQNLSQCSKSVGI